MMVIAAAFLYGIVSVTRSLRRLDHVVANVSKEAEASLRQCSRLAEEASEAISVTRQSMQGFATFAEGARALGEAVQTVAQTAVQVTELYREKLTAPLQASAVDREPDAEEPTDLADVGRKLWSMWKRRAFRG
jgi:uncharacterized protein YoxC